MREIPNKEVESQAFSTLFRHFLSLGFVVEDCDNGRPTGILRGFCTSGTLFEYKGIYAILTAGHVLQDIKRMVEEGRFVIHSCHLIDSFGHNGIHKEPYAFDYDGAAKEFIYDKEEGIDFGLVGLRPYYLGLIAANGLVPIGEAQWRQQHRVKFDFYFMAGLPSCWTEVTIHGNPASGQQVEFKPCATCFRVDRRRRRPGGVAITRYRRFIGHISKKVRIDNIEGMSGGPILGFRKSERGLEYWVVAVQSSWLEKRRLAFACPLPTIGELLDDFYDQMIAENHEAELEPVAN